MPARKYSPASQKGGNTLKRLASLVVLLAVLCIPAQAQQKLALSASSTDCSTAGSCLSINLITSGPTKGNVAVGGSTITVGANASSNTLQFEASGDGGTTWVALNATPSNSTTAATSTTSTGVWQANLTGYTNVRVRMSTLSGGTSTVSIVTSTASAKSGGGGGLAPNTPGIPTSNGPNLIYASNYGVKAAGVRYFDASMTNTGKNVTVNNDANESDVPCSSSMVGWGAFGTNYSVTGAGTTSTTIIRGTITGCNSATSFAVSNAATAGCTSSSGIADCEFVIYPSLDTTALLAAWNAVVATSLGPNCGTLMLPQGVIPIDNLIQAQISGISNCGVTTTGNGAPTGITVGGQGRFSTQIIAVPSANWTALGANKGAFFYLNNFGSNSVYLHDFSIDGAGQIVNGNGLVPTNGFAIALGQDSIAQNVGVLAWGVPIGINAAGGDGAEAVIDHCYVTAGSAEPVSLGQYSRLEDSDVFWAIGTANVVANGINIHMHGNTLDNPQAAAINLSITGATTEVFSDGDSFTACAVTACKFISVTSGARLQMNNGSAFGANAGSMIGLSVDATPSFARVENTHFNIGGASSQALNIAGQLFDIGGNTFTGTSANTIAGSVFGSASITGTAQTTGNIALTSGWDTSTVTSASGDSHRMKFAISVTGVPGASPVITVTFPTSYLVAPASCSIQEVSGTFGIITNPSFGAPTTTSVAITFSGTPIATNTYTFDLSCGP